MEFHFFVAHVRVFPFEYGQLSLNSCTFCITAKLCKATWSTDYFPFLHQIIFLLSYLCILKELCMCLFMVRWWWWGSLFTVKDALVKWKSIFRRWKVHHYTYIFW